MNVVETPLVSIITPTYNSEKYIGQTIQSVINQTYSNWELIIVDDCSEDNTNKIVAMFAKRDRRIKYIKMNNNSGAAVARNEALNISNGRFIAFLDSDDLWKETKIEHQIKFMMEKNIGFSFTSYQLISEDGEEMNKTIIAPNEVDYNFLLKNTIIGCLTVMLDKDRIGNIKMPNIRSRQDTALWLQILKKGHKAYGLDEVLAKYRKVSNSISSNKFKASWNTWKVYRKVEKINFVKSLWYFLNYSINALKKM